MKNLSRYDLLDKITSINYEGANVQIRFDTNYNMYWKMDTNSTISFGREKISYKDINESLSSIFWKEDSGVSVNMVLNFASKNLIAIWTSDQDIHAIEGNFNTI